jgi:septum formation protein
MKRIVLASQSPRRKDILKQIGLKFEILPSEIKEEIDNKKTIIDNVKTIALNKAMDVAGKIQGEALVIGADTMVVQDEILGKPSNIQEAKQMLSKLSGKSHQVITGVAVVDTSDNKKSTNHQITDVTMRNYGIQEIDCYIASGECWDKAGSYAIQGLGALLVKEVYGDYFNVVGLPISLLDDLLREFDFNIFSL